MKRFNRLIKYLVIITSLLVQIFFIAGCEDSFTPIVPRTLEPLLSVSIKGDPIIKEELVATTNPADATASYQWLMATEENGEYEEIPEATNKTFLLTEEYLTKFIRVKATGKGEYVGIVASTPLGPISKPNYYRIYTYKQNIDDDEYTLESNEIIEEKVGTEIIADYEDIEGFIPNLTHPNRVESGTVRRTNRFYLRLYYDRVAYNVNFETDGGTQYQPEEEIRYGSKIDNPDSDNPKKTGYTFRGWFEDSDFTTPWDFNSSVVTGETTLYSKWTPNTDTAYKVEHYRKELASNTFVLSRTDDSSGTTGELTSATPFDYIGFTAQPINQKSIAADGSTTVEVYYDRNEYTLAYEITGDFFAEELFSNEAYEYEAKVTAVEKPSQVGYVFEGWSNVPNTMPARDVVATGYYRPSGNTRYKVEHYRESVLGDTYTEFETETLTGTTGAKSVAVAKTYSGFSAQPFEQKDIAPDGSTIVRIYYNRNTYNLTYGIAGNFFADPLYEVVDYKFGASIVPLDKPMQLGYSFEGWSGIPATMPARDVTATGYYTANTDTAYKVEHYRQDLGADTYTLVATDTDIRSGTTAQLTDAVANDYEGFTAKGIKQKVIVGDGSTVVEIYYDRNEYTLTYAIEGSFFSDNSYATEIYEYEADVVATATPSRVGYTFVGWENVPNKMPASDVTATGYYTANTDTPYKVEHYLQDLGTNTYTLKDTDNLTGITGQSTSASIKSYTGFTDKPFWLLLM